jgi:hypothetical protein
MRILWTAAIIGWLALALDAHADTVFLKDGQSVWAPEVTEQGETVIVGRPGGVLRIPKSDVARIERVQISIPRFYSPPGEGDSNQLAGVMGAAADRPPAGATPSQESAPGPGSRAATTSSPRDSSPSALPPGPSLTPTVLPPPPPRGPYAPR